TSHTQARTDQSVVGNARAPATPDNARTALRVPGRPGNASRLHAMREAFGEHAREPGLEDLGRRGLVIVRHAAKGGASPVLAPQAVRGPRIGVARRPDTADVDDVPPPVVEGNAAIMKGRAGQVLVRRAARAQRPYAGSVRVPDEAQTGREVAERLEPVLRRQKVVPLLGTPRACGD